MFPQHGPNTTMKKTNKSETYNSIVVYTTWPGIFFTYMASSINYLLSQYKRLHNITRTIQNIVTTYSTKFIWGNKMPPLIRLMTISWSSFLGNFEDVPRAAHDSHSSSSLRKIFCRFGDCSNTDLINLSCCSSDLNPTNSKSFKSQFLELSRSISHWGFLLSELLRHLSSSSKRSMSHACSHTSLGEKLIHTVSCQKLKR